jgi:hypothetical protein
MDTLAQLQAVDQTTLTPLVRKALGSDSATLLAWHVAPFGDGAGRCVYRFAGSARDHEQHVPWSLIVKVTTATARDDDPSAARYWKREMLAYQSGLPWPRERFCAVARQLGIFGAAYVTGRPVPAEPWLSRGWFRSFLATRSADVAALPTLLDHPQLRPAISSAAAARILQLWKDREALFDALDRLPQTFCHLDINPRNLFVVDEAAGASRSVAIDWEYAGVSALGVELASLVGGSLLFGLADLDTAADLEAAVFANYLDGLRETGWTGNPGQARLGYTISLGLHLVFIVLLAVVAGTQDAGFRQWAEQVMGRPYPELLDRNARLLDFLLARTDEARALLRSV